MVTRDALPTMMLNAPPCLPFKSLLQVAPVVEELFELQVNRRRGVETIWCNDFGRTLPSKDTWQLPSKEFWVWEDEDWKLDRSGAVDRETGWESSRLEYADSFRPARTFRKGDRFYRRRWTRKRAPVPTDKQTHAEQLERGRDVEALSSGNPNGTVIMFQTRFPNLTGAQLSVKIGDSSWAGPLDVSLEGAGGAFQVIGNRWPNLEDRSLDRTFYELTYSVSAAPIPWDRTKVITIQNRYMLTNSGISPLVISQAGTDRSVTYTLSPFSCIPFHWPDFQRDGVLQISFPQEENYLWSGGIDISQISELPLVIRPNKRLRKSSSMDLRVVRVKVELGLWHDSSSDASSHGKASSASTGTMLVSLSEVPQPHYSLSFNSRNASGFSRLPADHGAVCHSPVDTEDGDGPSIVLENCSEVNIYVAQANCSEEDVLPPYTGRCFGWDRTAFAAHELEASNPFQIRVARYPSTDSRAAACSGLISPDEVGAVFNLPIDSPLLNMTLLGRSGRCGSRQSLAGVTAEVCAEGAGTRVLRFKTSTDDDGDDQRRKRRDRSLVSLPWKDGGRGRVRAKSPGLTDLDGTESSSTRLRLRVPSLTVSVVDETPEELLVLGLSDVVVAASVSRQLSFLDSSNHGISKPKPNIWQGHLSLGSVQMDNHVAEAHFPVVLRPADVTGEFDNLSPTRNGGKSPKPPCITVVLQLEPRSRITYLKYVYVRSRQLCLNLDQSVVMVCQRLVDRVRSFTNKTGSDPGNNTFTFYMVLIQMYPIIE